MMKLSKNEKGLEKSKIFQSKKQEEKETKQEAVVETKEKKEKTLNDLPGVGPATVEKMQSVGYNDLMAVAVATPCCPAPVSAMIRGFFIIFAKSA